MKWKVWLLKSYLVPYIVKGPDDKQDAVDAAILEEDEQFPLDEWEEIEPDEGEEVGAYVEILED